jgi:hypothetical protein
MSSEKPEGALRRLADAGLTMATVNPTPLLFRPEFEQVAEDEQETTQGLIEALHSILETTNAHYRHPVRSVHAKAHAFMHGQLQVFDGLPEPLAQGCSARPATTRS